MSTIELGMTVVDSKGTQYAYAGEHKNGRTGQSVSYRVGGGELPAITTDARYLMPASAVDQARLLDLRKDDRVSVVNDKAGRPGTWAGPWRALTPGDTQPTWHTTKRDALSVAAGRLAIAEWHLSNDKEEGN